MSWAWRRTTRLGWLLAGLLVAALPASDARAQGPASPGWAPLAEALRTTLESGRPTVVVVTGADGGSQQLRGALPGILQTQAIGGLVQLAEMPAAEHAERLRQMQVNVVPTVLVYVRGERGLALADYKQGLADPYQLVGWLSGVRLPAAAPVPIATANDPNVQRTGYPSPQGSAPTPQAPAPPPYVPPQPPMQAPPPPVYTQPVQVPPVVTAPAPVPAVVSPPSQTFIVQPQPATLVMAPSPQPNIILAGSAPSAPTVMMAAAPSAAAPAPVNLMTQPAAAPTYAMAPAPTYAMASAPAPAYAPAPVGQGPVSTALITMVAPNLLESILGAIGNRLRRHGLPRMEMGQAPSITTVPGTLAAPAPTAGYAPAPAAPQMAYVPVGSPYAAQPPYAPEAPPYPVPSAQGHTHAPGKSGFFGR